MCVSSLRRGHANLLCIVPILSDDPKVSEWVIGLSGLVVGFFPRTQREPTPGFDLHTISFLIGNCAATMRHATSIPRREENANCVARMLRLADDSTYPDVVQRRWTERERTCPMKEILLWAMPKHPLGRYRPLSAMSCSTLRERAA